MADQMFGKEISINASHIPNNWDSNVCDFIHSLLYRKASQRLGNSGVSEIKSHPWLSSINWDELVKKELNPPFIPNYGNNFDSKYANKEEEEDTVGLYHSYLTKVNKKKILNNFYFNKYEEDNNNSQKTKSSTMNQSHDYIESTRSNQLYKSTSITNNKSLKSTRSDGNLGKSTLKKTVSFSNLKKKQGVIEH